MKVIKTKKAEADEFFNKVLELQSNKEIVDYICLPIYKDGSFDIFHTSMHFSNMVGIISMAKHILLSEWNDD